MGPTQVLIWDLCPLGLPVVLTVAHMGTFSRLLIRCRGFHLAVIYVVQDLQQHVPNGAFRLTIPQLVFVYMRICLCMYIHIYVGICRHMYVYVCICMCTYVCI